MKGKKNFKNSQDYMSDTSYGYKGKPEGDKQADYGIALKAKRGLPKSSFAVLADPYTAALPGSEPYPLLNQFNRLTGGVYGGVRNIDGGNVQQYGNSYFSKFLYYTDFLRTKVGINYRYIPSQFPTPFTAQSTSYPGKGLIDEQRRSIAEALSVLKSTTFYQLDIINYAVKTDMPMGSAETKTVTLTDDTTETLYTDTTDVLYAMGRIYQLILLNAINCINWHNSFRLKMGTMIRSAWDREVGTLNGLFGLFKKKSFLSLVDSLCLAFEGEYVDTDFMKQTSMLNLTPSRRSNSITDPLLEVQASYVLPTTFKTYYRTASGKYTELPIFDLAEMKYGDTSLIDAIEAWSDILSAEDTMHWARNYYLGQTTETDDGRYNRAKTALDVINYCLTKFKIEMADFRTALDTVVRAGLMTWVKGFRPSIVKDTDAPLFRNLLVDNLYQIAFGGSNSVDFDDATKRWRTYSLWNMYDGIPEYDAWSGGAFLTFSLKELNYTNDTDNTLNNIPIGVVPDRNIDSNLEIKATDRMGNRMLISPYYVTISTNQTLCRLAPLNSQAGLKMRISYAQLAATDETSLVRKSCLYKVLTTVLGACRINDDYALDPDILAVYQVEIEDITNNAISYARSHAMFRGSYNVGDSSSMGFLTYSGK